MGGIPFAFVEMSGEVIDIPGELQGDVIFSLFRVEVVEDSVF